MLARSVQQGGSIETSPATTRAGHDFEGWYSNSALTERVSFPYTVTGNVTLYAKWTPHTYTVTFESNGGSAVSSLQKDHGDTIAASPVTTLDGYNFDGWFTAADLSGSMVTFPYAVTGNITLYAKWTPLSSTYSVTFVTNGGSFVAALTNVTSISTEPYTSRSGYDFDGWFAASDFSGSRITFPYAVTEDNTLYAKWTEAEVFELIHDAVELYLKTTANLSGNFKLANDISMETAGNWVPVGTESDPFTGKIDGDGYKITGLKIDRQTEVYTGLFGYISGAAISNLAMEDVDIAGGRLAGAIAGYALNSAIINSYSTGDITSTSSGSGTDSFAGGIVGYVYATTGGAATITNSYSTGDISSSASGYRTSYAGGITGYVYNASLFGGATITDSYSMGNINASGSDVVYAGGIVGYATARSTITNSYSVGDISASTSGSYFSYAGGIAGYFAEYNTTITNSYSMGDISASSSGSGTSYAGGIAGAGSGGAITRSYSMGDITSSGSGVSCAGGIAGSTSLSITITSSYSTGNISIFSSGTSYVGGIVGNSTSTTTITDSYSMGDISASGSGNSYAGGIAGSGGTITDSYSTGNISAFNSSGFGNSHAGGITGSGGSAITNSYSIGDISASSSGSSSIYGTTNIYAGGVTGSTSGAITITDSYSRGDISATGSGNGAIYTYAGGITSGGGTITNSYSIGDISAFSSSGSGYSYAGGIAGSSTSTLTITSSYSTGNISASGSVYSYAGGIAGNISYSALSARSFITSSSYSTGNISASGSGASYAGGITGYLSHTSSGSISITNCAAVNQDIAAENFAGRITGYVSGATVTISNNFALNTMTVSGGADFDTSHTRYHGVSRTDEQLRTQATYSGVIAGDGMNGLGWKFGGDDDNPWTMPAGGGYPILYWQQE